MEDLLLICNIPKTFHSKDLRNYFHYAIESNIFKCFHFRRRPLSKLPFCRQVLSDLGSNANQKCMSCGANSDHQQHTELTENRNREIFCESCLKNKLCCIIQTKKQSALKEVTDLYSNMHWIKDDYDLLIEKCSILNVTILEDHEDCDISNQKPLEDKKAEINMTQSCITIYMSKADVGSMPELKPPVSVMPHGNVGTPRQEFLQLINSCTLPSRVVSKLNLSFPKKSKKRCYSETPYDYGTSVWRGPPGSASTSADDMKVMTASGTELMRTATTQEYTFLKTKLSDLKKLRHEADTAAAKATDGKEDAEESSDDDDDTCESWERHLALHDDVDTQSRSKERVFEEEQEVTWEKGGPGLVWYTDASYWEQQEGDFDEQTADDWDVDMSVYYDKHGGDRDSRAYVELRQSVRRRDGVEGTDYVTAGHSRSVPRRVPTERWWREEQRRELGRAQREHHRNVMTTRRGSSRIGKFEKHTKGVGRKVMERYGWSDGQGLGSTIKGRPDALKGEGQPPRSKLGFGYHGERLPGVPQAAPGTSRDHQETTTTTTSRARVALLRRQMAQRDRDGTVPRVCIATKYDSPQDTDPTEHLLRRNDTPATSVKHRRKS